METLAPVSLEALRRRLAIPAEARTGPARLGTGFSRLDQALGGGLPAGRLSEIAGAPSSGKTTLVLGLLARQTGAGKLAAFVDGRGQLYPPAAALCGVDLSRLLLARPPRAGADDVARAAEILARSRAFSLIVLEPPARDRLPAPRLRRLRSVVHASGAALVVLTDRAGALESAAVRLEVCARRRRRHAPTRPLEVRVRKGSAGGAPARIAVELGGRRFDVLPPEPAAPPVDRLPPGSSMSQEVAR